MHRLHIANAPCSWGVLELEGAGGEQVGYQQMLDELAAAGYTGTELGDWGYMPTESSRLRAELESRALSMRGAFVPVALWQREALVAGRRRAISTARLLAGVATPGDPPFLVLSDQNGMDPERRTNAGRITSSMGLSSGDWTQFANSVHDIAGAVKEETGLQTVFHHHCAGYVETPDEIEQLLSLTDPALVGLVFDTGHYAYGAGACDRVCEGIDRFVDRIWYVHFKDCMESRADQARLDGCDYLEAVGRGIFCELGKGDIDFVSVRDRLCAHGYEGWIVVEQDVLPGMGAPRESAQRNRNFLRSLGL